MSSLEAGSPGVVEVLRNSCSELGNADGGSVLCEVLLNCGHGGGFDRLWGGEVGLAGTQINHVNSLCFQLLGLLHYGNRRRGSNSPQSIRKFHQNGCLSVMNRRDYIEESCARLTLMIERQGVSPPFPQR